MQSRGRCVSASAPHPFDAGGIVSEVPDKEAEIERLAALWSEGRAAESLALAEELSARFPDDAALAERAAIVSVHLARENPGHDYIGPALAHLDRALAIDPDRHSAREVRASLLMLLAHRVAKPELFRKALEDFLRLEKGRPDADAERVSHWRLEAARAAFLFARNSPADQADYALATNLYSRADAEQFESSDWFFRGLAALEEARRLDDPQTFRLAAGSFQRSFEDSPAFQAEGRYFAADALLSLEKPTEREYVEAKALVSELEAMSNKGMVIDMLKERLALRAQLSGFDQSPGEQPPGETPAS